MTVTTELTEDVVRDVAQRLAAGGFDIDLTLDVAALTDRINALLAAGHEHHAEADLIDPPACPSWCDGSHVGEQHVPEIRECTTADTEVLDMSGSTRAITGSRIFDRITGRTTRDAMVTIEDLEFTPAQAREAAQAMLRLADLLEA